MFFILFNICWFHVNLSLLWCHLIGDHPAGWVIVLYLPSGPGEGQFSQYALCKLFIGQVRPGLLRWSCVLSSAGVVILLFLIMHVCRMSQLQFSRGALPMPVTSPWARAAYTGRKYFKACVPAQRALGPLGGRASPDLKFSTPGRP